MDETDPAIGLRMLVVVRATAIDGDVMPPFRESHRYILHEGLEAAVVRWNPTGTQEGNSHPQALKSGYGSARLVCLSLFRSNESVAANDTPTWPILSTPIYNILCLS
ncbi:MAG: hypothetical protein AMXMBFR82_37530 [Candidatus Hydrogenedentota bacterium]